MKPTKHWTSKSIKDFVYRIASDFIVQLEKKTDAEEISRDKMATRLKVSPGRVSQVMNNPGNLTLKNIVQYARILGLKVAIVAYDDGDPDNERGPVNSEIFSGCWDQSGKPRDFFALRNAQSALAAPAADVGAVGNVLMIRTDPPSERLTVYTVQ